VRGWNQGIDVHLATAAWGMGVDEAYKDNTIINLYQ